MSRDWKGTVAVPRGALTSPLMVRVIDGLVERGQPFAYEGPDRFGDVASLWIGEVPKGQRPLCGARCRDGHACRARAVPGMQRCRMHGGLSTGPRTAEGRARVAQSNRRRAEQRRARCL